MAVRLRDVVLPFFMIVAASPVAIGAFRIGVPIELIVFSLLLVGYKGPHWLQRCRGQTAESGRNHVETVPHEPGSHGNNSHSQADSKAKNSKKSESGSWRANLPSLRSKNKTSADGDAGSWRRAAADNKKGKQDDSSKKEHKSPLAFLKKNDPAQKWRSIINKFTPEKFDKLCEQLLETLPKNTDDTVDSDHYKNVLDELLALIFESCSRQHQYTQMYSNLCSKLLDFVSSQQPGLDGRGAIWGRCQQIFLDVVLKPPDIPVDLPEDEYMDKKAKHKHMMVGMVKFGGELVSHGLVPADGVMHWIHALLSEKHYGGDERTDDVDSRDAESGHEKAVEEREVQLEVLCAILASMGSSLNDATTWSEENRLVIEDVFDQLEELTGDTKRLSTRMRCLIRDILDLRRAQWKEKEGKLKPGMLLPRKTDDENSSGLREDAPEFCPGTAWKSDKVNDSKNWADPTLLASLQACEHHLEVMEERDQKMSRLKALIQLYHFIQEQQLVIVANSSNVRRVLDLLRESFKDVDCKTLDFSTNEITRRKHLDSFEAGATSILVMASEISTRRDFDFTPPAVLINFDFPMTMQLYLYRIHKRSLSHTHVYTFFSPQFDVRHTLALIFALEGARQKVPAALQKLKETMKADSGKDNGNRRDGGSRSGKNPKADSSSKADGDDDGAPPWKRGGDADNDHSARRGKSDNRDRKDARNTDGNWRCDDDSAPGSPSKQQSDDQQVRRREQAARKDGDQRGANNNRRGAEVPESRGGGKSSGPGRPGNHGDGSTDRRQGDTQSSPSTVRQRRHPEDASHVEGDNSRRTRREGNQRGPR